MANPEMIGVMAKPETIGAVANPEMISFSSGARSSAAPRYDLVPRVLLDAVERRFALGAKKYGDNQWRAGLRDPEFLRERANHALTHLLNYIYGTDNGEDSPEDNLAAVGWAVAVLLEAARLRTYECRQGEGVLNSAQLARHPMKDKEKISFTSLGGERVSERTQGMTTSAPATYECWQCNGEGVFNDTTGPRDPASGEFLRTVPCGECYRGRVSLSEALRHFREYEDRDALLDALRRDLD